MLSMREEVVHFATELSACKYESLLECIYSSILTLSEYLNVQATDECFSFLDIKIRHQGLMRRHRTTTTTYQFLLGKPDRAVKGPHITYTQIFRC